MARVMFPLTMLLASLIALMGCTPNPSGGSSASAGRIKSLESKCVRLEGDFRAACSARDKYRRDLAGAEQSRDGLQKQFDLLRKELEGFKGRLAVSEQERDHLGRQLALAEADRDELTAQRDTFADHVNRLTRELEKSDSLVKARTEERDQARGDADGVREQFESFRKLLRVQIDQAEAASNVTGQTEEARPVRGL